VTSPLFGGARPTSANILLRSFALDPLSPGVTATPFFISRLDSRAPYVSFRLRPRSTVVQLAALRGIALRWIVRRMPDGVPDSLRISFRFGRSSDALATAKQLARRLPHRSDKVWNTLTPAPAKVGVGQSPELLVLVGTDNRRPSNGVMGRAIPSAHGWVHEHSPTTAQASVSGIIPF